MLWKDLACHLMTTSVQTIKKPLNLLEIIIIIIIIMVVAKEDKDNLIEMEEILIIEVEITEIELLDFSD